LNGSGLLVEKREGGRGGRGKKGREGDLFFWGVGLYNKQENN
jgi:hypothetical protein